MKIYKFNFITGFQENTPELQLYEIPLDSVTSHPRISYMGARRVAPKKQEEKRRSSKDYKKKDGEYHTPSLTKYTKRDTVYNSVTDTCITSVLSEGKRICNEFDILSGMMVILTH